MCFRFICLVLFSCLMSRLPCADPEVRAESQLFVIGGSDALHALYDSRAEEVDLRGLLTRLDTAAQVTIEEKDDRVTTTMRLLRRSDAGTVIISKVKFTEVMSLTMTWTMTRKDNHDRDLVRSHFEGFMHAAQVSAASHPK